VTVEDELLDVCKKIDAPAIGSLFLLKTFPIMLVFKVSSDSEGYVGKILGSNISSLPQENNNVIANNKVTTFKFISQNFVDVVLSYDI